MLIENKAKKWRNSFGVVIPSQVTKEGQPLVIEIKLKRKIDTFGKFRGAKKFKRDSDLRKEFWLRGF